MLSWSLQRGNFQMGLVEQTPIQEELFFEGKQSEAPEECQKTKTADLGNDSNGLAAARGVVWGVFLGGIIWAVILWVLL